MNQVRIRDLWIQLYKLRQVHIIAHRDFRQIVATSHRVRSSRRISRRAGTRRFGTLDVNHVARSDQIRIHNLRIALNH